MYLNMLRKSDIILGSLTTVIVVFTTNVQIYWSLMDLGVCLFSVS